MNFLQKKQTPPTPKGGNSSLFFLLFLGLALFIVITVIIWNQFFGSEESSPPPLLPPTQPPPPATQPPPATDPPETDPPETDPPETDPPSEYIKKEGKHHGESEDGEIDFNTVGDIRTIYGDVGDTLDESLTACKDACRENDECNSFLLNTELDSLGSEFNQTYWCQLKKPNVEGTYDGKTITLVDKERYDLYGKRDTVIP